MLLAVHGVECPEGLQSAPCGQEDLIAARVHVDELCDVVDAPLVGHPHAVVQVLVPGNLLLGVDGQGGLGDRLDGGLGGRLDGYPLLPRLLWGRKEEKEKK